MASTISLMKLDIIATVDIDDACEKALQLADQEKSLVVFTFNGVTICVHPGDTLNRIQTEYYVRKGKGLE